MVSADGAKWTKDNFGTQSVDKAPFSAADPDIQMGGVGEGRAGGHPDPEIRGMPGLKKIFFRPLAPQFGLKIRGAGPLGPSPRSATDFVTVPGH